MQVISFTSAKRRSKCNRHRRKNITGIKRLYHSLRKSCKADLEIPWLTNQVREKNYKIITLLDMSTTESISIRIYQSAQMGRAFHDINAGDVIILNAVRRSVINGYTYCSTSRSSCLKRWNTLEQVRRSIEGPYVSFQVFN